MGTLSGLWMLINGGLGTLCQETVAFSGSGSVLGLGGQQRVPHHVFQDGSRWKVGDVEPHGKVDLNLEVCFSAYKELQLGALGRVRGARVTALADTGAQMCLADV